MKKPSVSVVIPTIGRPELRRALDSALRQTMRPVEVIVVNDSSSPLEVGEDGHCELTTLWTGGGRGAAASRNAGMEAARGDLIAFLDDDDAWLPHHLASAYECLSANAGASIYSSASLALYPDYQRIEPTVAYDGRRSLLSFFYGDTVWARRRRRIPTSSIVFRQQVRTVQMDESLQAHEDLLWLLEAERAGHRLLQVESVDVVCWYDAERETSRLTLAVTLDWASRLDRLKVGAGANYLVGHLARTLARRGQSSEFHEVSAAVRDLPTVTWQARLVLWAERVLLGFREPRRTQRSPGSTN